MIRSLGMLTLVSLLITAASAQAHDLSLRKADPHIRSTDGDLRDAVASGALRSPTLRALVATIDASDVVVYVK